jgi:hypothetical protein
MDLSSIFCIVWGCSMNEFYYHFRYWNKHVCLSLMYLDVSWLSLYGCMLQTKKIVARMAFLIFFFLMTNSTPLTNFCGNSIAYLCLVFLPPQSFCSLSHKGCWILWCLLFDVISGYIPYKLFKNLTTTIYKGFFYQKNPHWSHSIPESIIVLAMH